MDGATRNLLIEISRNGGSLFAGTNAHVEPDPVIDRAIEAGFLQLRANSWAAGDYYIMTSKGWSAIGHEPPPLSAEEMGGREVVFLLSKIAAALIVIAVISEIISALA